MIFNASNQYRQASEFAGGATEPKMGGFAQRWIAEEWTTLFGLEDEMEVNLGMGFGYGGAS
jgi:hypothetical protein